MGIGKVLGFAALGVAAVAAAPFTGGGSILGAASLGASLAGAGAIAAATGAAGVGAAAGVYLSRREEEEEEEKNEKFAELNLKIEKLQNALKETIDRFSCDRDYFNFIIALTAAGLAMANADGDISTEELDEINSFISGVGSSNYPPFVKDSISNLEQNIPNFNTAMSYLEKVDSQNIALIRDLFEVVMEADGVNHDKEIAFLSAFDATVGMIEYKPDTDTTEMGNEFISQRQNNSSRSEEDNFDFQGYVKSTNPYPWLQ